MNNCCVCGQLVRLDELVEMKIQGRVANPLKNTVNACIKDIEWIPGTFRHRNCQHPITGRHDGD